MTIAALDLGTNTFHLLIAKTMPGGSWKRLARKQVAVMLGKGGIHKGRITEDAYKRGILALEQFHALCAEYQVKRIDAVGTAALRSAANGKQFLDEALSRFGFNVRVIDGREEAMLIYHGARQAVRLDSRKTLVMDIGGGSVEFIIANESRIFWQRSFNIGAALLLGRFNPGDPFSRSDVLNIEAFLARALKPLFDACRKHDPVHLVGTAGSFETFASMIRHRFPESGNHYGKKEHPISLIHFKNLFSEIVVSQRSERLTMKGLIKMRVDMIVMAALMLNFVLSNTGIRHMKLSAYSLKEGVIWKLLQKA